MTLHDSFSANHLILLTHVAKDGTGELVFSWTHKKKNVNIKKKSTNSYEVVELVAAKLYYSAKI